ncbi:hypothetical protein GZL_06558 [Streptomyces sp. 769]|nr:hypothetical protein GZL_06558 [Streptomyces sp. 769]
MGGVSRSPGRPSTGAAASARPRPRFAVRGSRFAVRGSRFAVRGSRFAVRGQTAISAYHRIPQPLDGDALRRPGHR